MVCSVHSLKSMVSSATCIADRQLLPRCMCTCTDTKLREVQPAVSAAMAFHGGLPAPLMPDAQHLGASGTKHLRSSTPIGTAMDGSSRGCVSPATAGHAWTSKLLSASVDVVPPTPMLLQQAEAARRARHTNMGFGAGMGVAGLRGSAQRAGGSTTAGTSAGLFGGMARTASMDPATGLGRVPVGGGHDGMGGFGGGLAQRQQPASRASTTALPAQRMPSAGIGRYSAAQLPTVSGGGSALGSSGSAPMEMSPAPVLLGHGRAGRQAAAERVMCSPVDMEGVVNGDLMALDGEVDDLLVAEDQGEWRGGSLGSQQPVVMSTYKTAGTILRERETGKVAAAMAAAQWQQAGDANGGPSSAAGALTGVTMQSLGLGITPQPTPEPCPNRKLSYSKADGWPPMITPSK